MVLLKRKQVMVISVAALVAIAGYLSQSYGKEEKTAETLGEVKLVSGDAEGGDVFDEARLEREIGRSESVANLQGIAADEGASAEVRANAETKLLEIATHSAKEANAESILSAQGFPETVIYIADGKVTAMVKTTGLKSEDVAKIAETITRETGIPTENIKIIETA